MTDGIIQQVFKKWLDGKYCNVYDEVVMFQISLGTLEELQQELIEKIKEESINRKQELTNIGYCLRQEEIDNFEKILIGDNKE